MRILVAALLALQSTTGILERVGQFVEGYYGHARTIVGRETLHLQPLGEDLRPDGPARELVYEIRVEWHGAAGIANPPTLVRTRLAIRGELPGAREEPECLDPEAVSFEPLGMLLPDRQPQFVFTMAGRAAADGRAMMMLDYRPVARDSPRVTWSGQCASVDLRGHLRGRLWADSATGEVRRVDQWIAGPYQFALPIEHVRKRGPISQTIDRFDTSIRFSEIRFRDPDETVLLPATIRTVTLIHNAGVPRLLKTQTFSDYKRFVTGARVVK